MKKWKPKIKTYCHFDEKILEPEIIEFVTTPERVTKNSFYPLIKRTNSYVRFSGNLADRTSSRASINKKDREIKYASRRDSYIYSYYRHLISFEYEKVLQEKKLDDVVLAYRSLKDSQTHAGKCNIHFARDAFLNIKNKGNCYAVALDIKGFFDNLPHDFIKSKWCELLAVEKLPEDHYAVYKSITKYKYVDYYELMERLNYYGPVIIKGKEKLGFLCSKKKIPKKICSNSEFRVKVCGSDGSYQSLIMSNSQQYGIPQGTPISDLIANFCLLDFDEKVNLFCSLNDVIYRRYSDDILLIFPDNCELLSNSLVYINNLLEANFQGLLRINEKKSIISRFILTSEGLSITKHHNDNNADIELNQSAFEYLGFSFDGCKVLLKDSTLSRFYRKISLSIRAHAKELINRYTGFNEDQIKSKFDYAKFLEKYGRVRNFDREGGYENWSFWSYTKRSQIIMSEAGFNAGILKQIRNYKKFVLFRLTKELHKNS